MLNKIIKYRILIARHGESIWNHDSKFTGWTNIPLSKNGIFEAEQMTKSILSNNLYPNIFFTSVLDRAIDTTTIIKNNIDKNIPIHTSWRLNEKHYGTLEGIPRDYIRNIYGEKFTQMMRSNFYMKPPIIKDNQLFQNNEFSTYKNCYFETIQNGESKENVLNRLIPYYENDILYTLTENKFPFIITHKHTARVLMKYLLKMDDETFENYNLIDKKILLINLDKKFNYINHDEISYN
jgi:2,3-bisphosphoglycerate-dependent phosphoglycerate mutase